ncbi:MAG: DMT family transporter [Haloechinothrix sp.]
MPPLITAFAIACAVASALCAALGAYLQHGGVGRVSGGEALRLRSAPSLVRDRRWLLGLLALVGTAVFQILAISMAPLIVVQPIVVLALPIVAVLGARAAGARLGKLAMSGTGATAGGLALFVVLATGGSEATEVSGEQALFAGKLVGAAALALVLFASTRSGRPRCVTLSVAAGSLYGLVSVLVRHISQDLEADAAWATIPWASVVALVAAHLTGSWLVQLGYASGPPDLVVACHSVLNPMVAVAIGVSLLGETEGIGAMMTTSLAACAGLAVAGIVLLARSHASLVGEHPAARVPRSAGRVPRS